MTADYDALDLATVRCLCGHLADLHSLRGCSECTCVGLPSFAFRTGFNTLMTFTELMKSLHCDYCDAEPGHPCHSKSGRRISIMHSARFYAAKQALGRA